jgi:hypothetical protein
MRTSTNRAIEIPAGTIGAWLRSLRGESSTEGCPFWPPDLFALTGSVLRRTGAYRRAFTSPIPNKDDLALWNEAQRAGVRWRGALDKRLRDGRGNLAAAIPSTVRQWWTVFVQANVKPLSEFADLHTPGIPRTSTGSGTTGSIDPVRAAICLTIAADQACEGVGLSNHVHGDAGPHAAPFLFAARAVLEDGSNDFRSLCLTLSPDGLSVLPKQHTPQTGLTFRSMSHHLALVPSGEIRARWREQRPKGSPDVFNLLLLPWPLEVGGADFSLTRRSAHAPDSHDRAFDYKPRIARDERYASRWVAKAIREANKPGGHVNALVLPECALTWAEFLHVENVAVQEGVMLIAGVRTPVANSNTTVNACVVQPRGLLNKGAATPEVLAMSRFIQPKHHRWRLDRNQILQYGLGDRLPAVGRLWENITLHERDLNFISLGSWMTWCALICEDLARQEPAAEVVRAVGPNLVIALLMDGPQLTDRWSARYATGLAEDPGCSVLTLTNLGLLMRSRPLDRLGDPKFEPDRTIALWRDAISGPRELRLSPEDNACMLSLACHSEQEFTVDGRGDGLQAHHPVYAGHRGLCVKPP